MAAKGILDDSRSLRSYCPGTVTRHPPMEWVFSLACLPNSYLAILMHAYCSANTPLALCVECCLPSMREDGCREEQIHSVRHSPFSTSLYLTPRPTLDQSRAHTEQCDHSCLPSLLAFNVKTTRPIYLARSADPHDTLLSSLPISGVPGHCVRPGVAHSSTSLGTSTTPSLSPCYFLLLCLQARL